MINRINRHIEKCIGNKYLMLVSTDESKDMLKRYEELGKKFKDLIRSTANNSDNYDEKYLEIKFNSVDSLPLNKNNIAC